VEPTNNEGLGFWGNILDGQGNPTLTIAVETETGKPVRAIIRNRETLEPMATFIVPPSVASSIGQALMLASTMKQSEIQQSLTDE
jgi:hypothetical protein